MTTPAKNLSTEAPRSPRLLLNDYVILGRMIDKGRAVLSGTAGEYHFGCPLDQMLLEFKGVKADDVKAQLASGADDNELATWFDGHGTTKSSDEKNAWSKALTAAHPYENPEKKDWFVGVCDGIGIDPKTSSLFDYLDADDALTFKK